MKYKRHFSEAGWGKNKNKNKNKDKSDKSKGSGSGEKNGAGWLSKLTSILKRCSQ